MTTSRRDFPQLSEKRETYAYQFVDNLPDELEDGVLYISIRYTTAAHNCFCGCGHEVVTPLHPTKWKLSFDGIVVSLKPSIGSWSLNCKSHYWLEDGRICWADTFNEEEIREVQRRDQRAQQNYYAKLPSSAKNESIDVAPPTLPSHWRKIRNWFGMK